MASIIQTATPGTGTGSTTATFTASTTPGNAVVSVVIFNNPSNPPTPPTAAGETFHLATESMLGGTYTAIYRAYDIAGGWTSLSENFGTYFCCCTSHPGSGILFAYEVAGLVLTDPLDKTATSTNSYSTGTTSVTSQPEELVVGGLGYTGGTTVTAPPGWGNLSGAAFGFKGAMAAEIVHAVGAQGGTFGGSGAGALFGAVATFKAAATSTSSATSAAGAPGAAQLMEHHLLREAVTRRAVEIEEHDVLALLLAR